MASALFWGIGGTVFIAAGIWQLKPGVPHDVIRVARAIILFLCGLLLLIVAARQGELSRSESFAISSVYFAAGISLGMTIWAVSAKRRAGLMLLSLGTTIGSGAKITLAISISMGILSVIMQAIGADKRSIPGLVGWTLFFTTAGIQAVLVSGTVWRFSAGGIIGPNLFVPWHQILAYKWRDPNTLEIAARRTFSIPGKFNISVNSELRERANEILATRVADHRMDLPQAP